MKYIRMKAGKSLTSLLLILTLAGSLCTGTTALAGSTDRNSDTGKITVTYGQTEARGMLDLVNAFRTGSEAWYWNKNDTDKTTYTAGQLSSLTYDYNLEQIAMQRAAEIAVKFDHTRPDGTKWSGLTYNGAKSNGENIAAGQTTAVEVFNAWQETDEKYSGQGHRRNMLGSHFKAIGIGHAYYNGCHYWVQEFATGISISNSATTANNSSTEVEIKGLGSTGGDTGTTPGGTTGGTTEGTTPGGTTGGTEGKTGECGDNLAWKYDSASRMLTISGTGAMVSYDWWGDIPWWDLTVEKLNLEEGVTKITDRAFGNCRLTAVEFPASLREMEGDPFDNCETLSSIAVRSGNTAYSAADGVLYNKDQTELIRYPSGKTGNRFAVPAQVRKIGSKAFWFCNNLSEVALTDNIEEIGSYAFWECYIKNVYFGKNLSVVGESAFGHTKLTRITLPSRVTWGKGLFEGCSSLTRAVIEEGITEIPDGTFDSCISLAEVSLPSSLRTIGRSAFEYTALKAVTLPDRVTAIGSRAFYQSEKLESIMIPKSVVSIGEVAFKDSKKLTVKCYADTEGYRYAKANNIPYELITSSGKTPVSAPATYKVSKITLSGISNKIAAGKKIKLSAKIAPSNATNKKLAWKSSNKKVATVSSTGVVTMKKGSGGKSVTITATAKDGSGKKAVYKIKSMKGAVTSVRLSGKKTVKAGKSVKLKAVVKAQKNANKAVKWTSSNTKYAKVSKSGKVTAYKAGKGKTVTVTVQAVDGTGKKAKLKIKIK